MAAVALGIFTVDGSGKGQAVAWRNTPEEIVSIPEFRVNGKPAFAGDGVTVLTTGLNCGEPRDSANLVARLRDVPVALVATSPSTSVPGACELRMTIPEGVRGDAVPVRIEAVDTDGRMFLSNTATIAIVDKE